MLKDTTRAFFIGALICEWKFSWRAAVCKNVKLIHANIYKVAFVFFSAIVCVTFCFVN